MFDGLENTVTEESNEAALTMTVRLTTAYLEGNPLPAGDLASLIDTIHAALRAVGTSNDELAPAVPAVTIKKSITPEAITCLECGTPLSMLKRHLKTHHDMTPADYRARWSLPTSYPMTAPDYAARRSVLALKIGLGKKKIQVAATEPVSAETKKRGQRYPASRRSKAGK